MLGLPIPNIFLYRVIDKDGKLQNIRKVVDGLQRITTVLRFLKNEWMDSEGEKSQFKLDFRTEEERRQEKKTGKKAQIDSQLQGCTIEDLSKEDRTNFELFSFRCITIQQETPKDDTGIFYLFERLNTGGVVLTPMEVRNAIYSGTLLTTISDLLTNEQVCELLTGLKSGSKQFKQKCDESHDKMIEFILRLFAFYDNLSNYNKHIKIFLNDYCKENRNQNNQWLNFRKNLLLNAVQDDNLLSFIKKLNKKNDRILEAILLIHFDAQTQNKNLTFPEPSFTKDSKAMEIIAPKYNTSAKDVIENRINKLKEYLWK